MLKNFEHFNQTNLPMPKSIFQTCGKEFICLDVLFRKNVVHILTFFPKRMQHFRISWFDDVQFQANLMNEREQISLAKMKKY